jgi:DUF2934 family protein
MPKKRASEIAPHSSGGDPTPVKAAARKPRVAKPRVNGATQPVPLAVRKKVAPAPVGRRESAAAHSVPRDEVARLAYSYWESRGSRGGSPEEDWYRAEREVLSRARTASA